MIERQVTYTDLQLTETEVYAALGYGNDTADAATRREVEHLLFEIMMHVKPRFGFITTAYAALASFAPGPIILHQLKGSEALCWFVATAGQWYEDFQQRLMREGDMVRVYIANEIGSLIAEKTADLMELALEEQLTPKKLSHTNRFSPGYCQWAVNEQQQLFSLFDSARNPASTCGITLTPSNLMLPIKSVSGVIGIGHNVKKQDYQCHLCGLESCYKRKKLRNSTF